MTASSPRIDLNLDNTVRRRLLRLAEAARRNALNLQIIKLRPVKVRTAQSRRETGTIYSPESAKTGLSGALNEFLM